MMGISNFAEWFVSNPTTANEIAPEPDTKDQTQDFAALLATSYLPPPAQTTPIVVQTTAAETISETMTQGVEARPAAPRFELPADLMTPMAPASNAATDKTISSSSTIDFANQPSPQAIATQKETIIAFSASPKNIDRSNDAQTQFPSLPKNEGLNAETQFNPAPQRESSASAMPVDAPVLSENQTVRNVAASDSAPVNIAPAQSRSNESGRSVEASKQIAESENPPENFNAETPEFKRVAPPSNPEVIENRIVEIRHDSAPPEFKRIPQKSTSEVIENPIVEVRRDSAPKQELPSQFQIANDVREDVKTIESKSMIAPSTKANIDSVNTPRTIANQIVSSELSFDSSHIETAAPRELRTVAAPASTANIAETNSEPRFTEASSQILFESASEMSPKAVTEPMIAKRPEQVSIVNQPESIAPAQPTNILNSEIKNELPREQQFVMIPPTAERVTTIQWATSPLLRPVNVAASQINSEVIKTAAMIVKAIVTEPRQAQVAEAIPATKTTTATDAPSTDIVGAASNMNPIAMPETKAIAKAEIATTIATETPAEIATTIATKITVATEIPTEIPTGIKAVDASATPVSKATEEATITNKFVAASPVINKLNQTTETPANEDQNANDFALEVESDSIVEPLRTKVNTSSSSLPTTPMVKAVSNVADRNVNPVATEVASRAQIPATPEAQVVTTIESQSRTVANALKVVAQPPQMQSAIALEFVEHEAMKIENLEAVKTAQTLPINVSNAASNTMLGISESASNTTSSPIVAQTIPPMIEMAKTIQPNETQTLRLSLNPAELGRVEVEITRAENGRVTASLMAEQTETAQTLTQNISHLRESLERAGVSVEQLNVTTSPQLQQQTTQQFGQSSGQQAERQQHSSNQFTDGDSLPADQVTNGTAPTTDNKLLSVHA